MSQNSPECQGMCENLYEPFKKLRTYENASEHLWKAPNTPTMSSDSSKTINTSEQSRTSENASETIITIQNRSEHTKMYQNTSEDPLNVKERLWKFVKLPKLLITYENALKLQKFLNTLEVKERVRTFWKPLRTHMLVLEHLRKL